MYNLHFSNSGVLRHIQKKILSSHTESENESNVTLYGIMLILFVHRLMTDLTADFVQLLCINYDECQDCHTMSQTSLVTVVAGVHWNTHM